MKESKSFCRRKRKGKKGTRQISKSFWRKKNRQYRCDWNNNLSEEEKQKKVEYMRNYYLAHKK